MSRTNRYRDYDDRDPEEVLQDKYDRQQRRYERDPQETDSGVPCSSGYLRSLEARQP